MWWFLLKGLKNIFCLAADYEPLFTLATRLLQHFLKEDIEAPAPSVPSKSLIDPPTKLCSEILRLLLGLVKSHGQAAGASFGPAIIAKTAPAWAAAFACQRAEWYIFAHPSFHLFTSTNEGGPFGLD